MSRKKRFIWLAAVIVVLGAATAGTAVMARQRRPVEVQRKSECTVGHVMASEWPPDFVLTLLQEGKIKIKSAEQGAALWELRSRIGIMLSDWHRWGSARESEYASDFIDDPYIPTFVHWDDAIPNNYATYMVLRYLVRVAHEWDGVGDLPDFYGIAESRMYECDDRLIAKRRNGESYREFRAPARSSGLQAHRR